jgi:hypothetical protein
MICVILHVYIITKRPWELSSKAVMRSYRHVECYEDGKVEVALVSVAGVTVSESVHA